MLIHFIFTPQRYYNISKIKKIFQQKNVSAAQATLTFFIVSRFLCHHIRHRLSLPQYSISIFNLLLRNAADGLPKNPIPQKYRQA
jgi:hypothetical protein